MSYELFDLSRSADARKSRDRARNVTSRNNEFSVTRNISFFIFDPHGSRRDKLGNNNGQDVAPFARSEILFIPRLTRNFVIS